MLLIDDRPDPVRKLESRAALPPQAIDHARAVAIPLDVCCLIGICVPKDQPWIVELNRPQLDMRRSERSPIPGSFGINPALDVQRTLQPAACQI